MVDGDIAIPAILAVIIATLVVVGFPLLDRPPARTYKSPTIESVLDLGDFDIDPAFMELSPYWTLIVGGTNDQEALMGFIENTSVPREQKQRWEATLRELWAAYPSRAIPSTRASVMITCDCDNTTMRLTLREEADLEEIGNEMGRAMERSLRENPVIPYAR